MNAAASLFLTFLFSWPAGDLPPIVRSAVIPARSTAAALAAASVPSAAIPPVSMPAATAPPVSRSSASTLAVYDGIRDQLQGSGVPVLLPAALPRSVGPARSITVVTADRSGYSVGFSPEAQCYEALSCSFFHVSGFARAALADRSFRKDRPVRLSDGRRGFFRPQDCSGASCTEASLTFERFGAIYEIDVKAGHGDLTVLESAYRTLRVVR